MIGPIEIISIEKMNGFYCVPQSQAAEIKNWYLKNKRSLNELDQKHYQQNIPNK